MNASPLISIITPVYNVEQYLPQCIESIIRQTFQDWELILIDDGSRDRSGVICDEYALKDSRIRVLHKENTGQADSRNIALSMVRANVIGFVDSDDWIEPDMYKILYQTLIEKQADIMICGYFRDYKDETLPSCGGGEVSVYKTEEALSLILEDEKIKSFPCDKLFRKEVITSLFPQFFYYEDYSTVFKWFVNASIVGFVHVPFYHYRQRKSSTSNDGDPKKDYHFFVAEIERYKFVVNNSILSEKRNVFACKVIKVGLKQAKNIAKYAKDCAQGMEYLEKIKFELEKFNFIGVRELSLNNYLKRLKLFLSPCCFFYEVRTRNRLKFWKKNKMEKYYW